MGLDANLNVFGPSSTTPIGETDSSAPAHSTKKVDTLSRADQEALASMMLAGYPLLPPPRNVEYSTEASLEALALQNEQKMEDITKNMLESWSASIARDNELVREYLHSDAYRQWQATQSAAGKVDKLVSSVVPTSEFINWVEKRELTLSLDPLLSNLGAYMQRVHSNDPAAVASLPFGMVNFIAPGALEDNSSLYLRDLLVGANLPIQQGVRADLGLVGAIFSAGALNYAEATNTAQALSGKKTHSDKNLALNYGNRIVSLVTDPNFDNFLTAMFGRKGTKDQIAERVDIFKMVLASTALMGIYSSEAKYISRGDFEGMINGTTKPRSTTEASLVAIFQAVRDGGQVRGEVYQQMVAGLGDYASTNPNFSSFFKVDDAFEAIADRVSAGRKANASVPTNTPI